MDLSKLKTVHDASNYEQLTATLQSKPDYRNILINENNVEFLVSIAHWEFKHYKKHGCNGAAVLILKGMLHMPASKNWSMFGDKFITILRKWLRSSIDIVKCGESSNWWKFLETVMNILENLCTKDNLIKLLIVENMTKHLLTLVVNDKININKKILILRCLNKCSYRCGQQVKQYMRGELLKYFVELSKYMSTCGHMDMQMKLFQTLISWLLIKNDAKNRSEMASILFEEDYYSKTTIDLFIKTDLSDFPKAAAVWLFHHNSLTGNVLTVVYKKLYMGNTLLVGQQSRLHLNLGAKCLTVPLGQKILTNCSLPYSELLTITEDNAQTVEFVTGNQMAINIHTTNGPEFLYDDTADVIDSENNLIHIPISNTSEICKVEWSLQNIFTAKYKRIQMESSDRLSPTPSGSCYDFFSQSMELENTSVTSTPYGIKTMAVRGNKDLSPIKTQQRDKTPTVGSITLPHNGESFTTVMDDVMSNYSPSVMRKSTRFEQNSCLFDASLRSDISMEDSLPDIDQDLVNNIITDAFQGNPSEAPEHVSTSTAERSKKFVVTKSTSLDDSSEVISDTPSFKKQRIEVITLKRSGDCSLRHGSFTLRKRNFETKQDYVEHRREQNNELDIIDDTPTQTRDCLLRYGSYTPPKRKKYPEASLTRKKRKLYSPKDDAELFNEVVVEDTNSKPNAVENFEVVNNTDSLFDRIRMLPTYTENNQEDDVVSVHSMKLRARSSKVYNMSSDDEEDDIVISNKFANRLRRQSRSSSLKSTRRSAKKPKRNVKKPRQAKKTPKPNITKLNYTVVKKSSKSHEKEQVVGPDPIPQNLYSEVTTVNPTTDLNNSSVSLKSLNVEVEQRNFIDLHSSSDNFVTNIKQTLKKKDATKTLQSNIDDVEAQIDYIECSSSPKTPNYVAANKKKTTDIKSVASKSHDEIVPLEQLKCSKPTYNTSSQDFQTPIRHTRETKKPKAVAKNHKKPDTKVKTVQKSKDNLNNISSSEDSQIKKLTLQLQRLKNVTPQQTSKSSNMEVHETPDSGLTSVLENKKTGSKAQKKSDSGLTPVQKSNKSMTKAQEEHDNGLKPVQEPNKFVTKAQEIHNSGLRPKATKLPILKIEKLKNTKKPVKQTSTIDNNSTIQSLDNSQSIRRSLRILERQRTNMSLMSGRSSNTINDFNSDPDNQSSNSNSLQPSPSRNTSFTHMYYTRSKESTTSINSGLLVNTSLLRNCYTGHNEKRPQSICSEPSQEDISNVDPRETEQWQHTDIIIKILEVLKKQNEKFLNGIGQDTELLLEKFVQECEKQKNIITEKLKSNLRNSLEEYNDNINKLENILKYMSEK